ncbi:hypothetical protein PCCS19_15710 [Paenibacillus sp. CCS19]|uniref:hypothetical protein n=1 Tax=Paenibacillus sp. CCS19 TaxID=3158387 RepID=UPI00256DDDAD|nr:hypothetical protein [Paenibacillus cellulosilyticus]GMK38517.1 hypothetical protein PCCS19_15710 [Paenibacillus cellulosilyticus]
MTEEELLERLARIGPTKTQTERMLQRILNPSEAKSKPKRQWRWSYRIAMPAMLGMLLLAIGLPFMMNGKEEPAIVVLKPAVAISPMAVSITPRGFSLPQAGEIRKFLNYNGSRYEFLNKGEPYDLSELKLGESEPLGKLEYDIAADMLIGGTNGYASRDFGTTYLTGGTLYELPGYDPAFRLAVERDDRYYIVQLVGHTDDSVIAADDYAAVAHLDKLAERVELLDGTGSQLLHAWSIEKEVREWIKHIASFEPSGKLTNEQYEQLAKAEASGEAYTLRVALRDGTAIDMPLTPEMCLIAIGDNRYKLSDDWLTTYSYLFQTK